MEASPRLEGIHRMPEQILLMGVDGDGFSDLVRMSPTGIQLYINRTGRSFAPPQLYPTIPTPIPNTVRAVDLDGRAARGLLYNSQRAGQTGYVYVNWDQSTPPYLLQRVENGIGLASEIAYTPLVEMARLDRDEGRLWDTYMPFALWVVSATRETDNTCGRVTETHYRYHDGHFDPLFRRFQGFRHVDRREVGDESRADASTRYTFLMDQAALPGHTREHAHRPHVGPCGDVQTRGSPLEGRPYRSEETEYDVHELETLPDGTRRVFVFAHVTRKRYQERTADERVEEMTYAYDAFGNVTREVKRGFGTGGGVAVAEKTLISEFSYASDAGQTIFKPAQIVKRDAANDLCGRCAASMTGCLWAS